MKSNSISFNYDPALDMPIFNHMHGILLPCDIRVAKRGLFFEEALKEWREYAREIHNPNSITSAKILTSLMNIMDDARKDLRPFMDVWSRHRYGLGLN